MASAPELHLIKLCVGAETVADLERWQARQKSMAVFGRQPVCTTRNTPRRASEILGGGSLYWVFKGQILARQLIVSFEAMADETGRPRCGIVLDDTLVRTYPQPCKAFQGWRYLTADAAPPDLAEGNAATDLPPDVETALAAIGVGRRRA